MSDTVHNDFFGVEESDLPRPKPMYKVPERPECYVLVRQDECSIYSADGSQGAGSVSYTHLASD